MHFVWVDVGGMVWVWVWAPAAGRRGWALPCWVARVSERRMQPYLQVYLFASYCFWWIAACVALRRAMLSCPPFLLPAAACQMASPLFVTMLILLSTCLHPSAFGVPHPVGCLIYNQSTCATKHCCCGPINGCVRALCVCYCRLPVVSLS